MGSLTEYGSTQQLAHAQQSVEAASLWLEWTHMQTTDLLGNERASAYGCAPFSSLPRALARQHARAGLKPSKVHSSALLVAPGDQRPLVSFQQDPEQSLMHQVFTPRPVLALVPAFRAQARPAFKASPGRLRLPSPSASWSSWFAGSARKQVRLLGRV